MGAFDIACPICGGPTTIDPNFLSAMEDPIKKLLEWLERLVAIRKNHVPFFGTYDLYGRVENKDGSVGIDIYNVSGEAVGLHEKCWELAGKPDWHWFVKHRLFSGDHMYLPPFDKYSGQFYNWMVFVSSDDISTAFDPSTDETNSNRILKRIAEIQLYKRSCD